MIEEKDLWKCIPFLILPSLIFFFIGDTRWAVLSLGLIPLFVIGWDTYILYFSEEAKRMREIWKHLTETEQRQLKKLSGIYGAKCGALFGVSASGPFVILSGFFCVELAYIILAILAILAIEIPFTLRWRKPITDFAFSTQYAKEKGLGTL